MKIPKPLTNVIESFQKLPGIGPKTAQRLSYYLLHVPQTELEHFAESLSKLKKETVLCTICKNVSEYDPCPVCSDTKRDTNTILVVEQPLDVLAFERVGQYDGINPLENIGPDEIFIGDLLSRVKSASVESFGEVKEIIIATNPTMEGDATAMYIAKKIREITTNGEVVKITRLGMGVPTGADLEYADEATLREAIDGRRAI